MIMNIIDNILGIANKLITGNFTITKEELQTRIDKLNDRRRRIALELEEANHRMYVKGWTKAQQEVEKL